MASWRWPVAVFINLLDIAGINSWIIYKKVTGSKIVTVLMLSESLQKQNLPPNDNEPTTVGNASIDQPQKDKKRNTCVTKTCRNRTSNQCSVCDHFVCGKCVANAVITCRNCP